LFKFKVIHFVVCVVVEHGETLLSSTTVCDVVVSLSTVCGDAVDDVDLEEEGLVRRLPLHLLSGGHGPHAAHPD
jgi:hypothetical protein